MARIYDNWEKLVEATLKREQFRQLARADSLSSTSSSRLSVSSCLTETLILDIYSNHAIPLSYEQVIQATGDFSNEKLIRRGHAGDLFIGMFQCFPDPVVVKRIYAGDSEHFKTELDFFSRVSGHSRFVSLLGHCSTDEEKFLVYRYLSKGDLSSNLFLKPDEGEEEALTLLDWIMRLKIAIGVAEGLAYLHHECDPPIAHGDVQASSILLDDKLEVRLGSLSNACPQDLGFSYTRKHTRAMTTTRLRATCSDDVYSFGKVLLELVTGTPGTSSSPDATSMESWTAILSNIDAMDFVNEIVDRTLPLNEGLVEGVRTMAIVARSCLNRRPPMRPLMREVLRSLENSMKVITDERRIVAVYEGR